MNYSRRRHRSREKKPSFCCCCNFTFKRSNSGLCLEDDDEYCEYVVEKLVIKKVPIKQFTTERDIKKLSPKHERRKVVQVVEEADVEETPPNIPIVTFSSYYQMEPVNIGKKQMKVFHPELDVAADSEIDGGSHVRKQKRMPLKKQQKQSGVNDWNVNEKSPTYNVHKVSPVWSPQLKPKSPRGIRTQNDVLFTKPVRSRESTPPFSAIDPGIKETIDSLANKQPYQYIHRKRVSRDPNSGKIKGIFQNAPLEEPIKLSEIYKEDTGLKIADIIGKQPAISEKRNKKGLKWKIIIKHKDDAKNAKPSTSTYLSDSD